MATSTPTTSSTPSTASRPAARTLGLPIAHRAFTIKVNGQVVPSAQHLVSVTVQSQANRIASARLVYADGSASAGDFPLSSQATFVPGARVQISAGASDSAHELFDGLIVAHALKLRDNVTPQLVVDCRHAATRLAHTRRGRRFAEMTDAEVIEQLLTGLPAPVSVQATSLKHEQLVQFDATDWDFALRRAQAVGLAVFTRGGELRVQPPASSDGAVVTLTFGATLIELDASIDARLQAGAHHGLAWQPADQAVADAEAADPAFEPPGDLNDTDLATGVGVDRRDLRHAALPESESQAWADAAALHAAVNRVQGRAKCEGIGTVLPGDMVELAGCGAHFNGKVLVTGVRHSFDLVEGWKTHLQFGGLEPAEQRTAAWPARPARGLVPPVSGLQIGVVTSNEDPAGEHRVRVRLPLIDGGDDGVWARVASLDAGPERGFFFRPEIDDEVVVGFIEDDPRHPVLLGMLHSSARAAPEQGRDDNDVKLYRSRSGMRLHFDDKKTVATLDTPSGRQLVLDDDAGSITLADGSGNKLVMDDGGITVESASALTLKAGTTVSIEAGAQFELSAGAQLKLEGSAGVSVSSPGVTEIAGSLVRIN